MTVQVFARLRELAGRDTWTSEVPEGSTVRDVWRAFTIAHPAAEALTTSVSAAVNADFASMQTRVHDGDEVAFLPPVSGGGHGLTRA